MELIALIARWHRKGDPDPSALGALSARATATRLSVLCGMIRLAEQLERSRDQAVARVAWQRVKGGVRLEAEADAEGRDPSVAIWAAQRNADLLGEAIGERVEVVAAEAGAAAA